MKISYNWLKKHVNIDLAPEKVAEILTDTGLEVEGVEKVESIKGGLEGLVIGEVLTKIKHPDADKLSLTTVNIGTTEPLHIVCGAPNVAVGQKVVVATIGTTLYDGDESFQIKKSKIRGELSEGMLCGADEVGLGTDSTGIVVITENVASGTLAKNHFNVQTDFVLEIGLTPNRADATGHVGVARDIVAALNLQGENHILNIPNVASFKVDNNNLPIAVEVKNSDACKRYCGVSISGVTVAESPTWLQNSLKAIGLRPINNIVDATNYVLHETGQPLHAFDAEKITGNKVIVQTLAAGALFTTLDAVERKLSDTNLMICNATEAMCVAGVMGGLHLGVNANTKNIFLESAYFNPVSVRKTAKQLGLNTDSSFRFERGADPNNTLYALKRVALLIQEIAGGKISSEVIDIYPEPIQDFKVAFNYANCHRIIGKQISTDQIKNILTNLDIKIDAENEDTLQLLVPPYRVDVQREIDVIEEVLRIYGYNNIEIGSQLKSSLSFSQKPDKNRVKNVISDYLVSNGFVEAMNNSLTKSSYYEGNELVKREACVEILNPLSVDLDVMRQSLLFGGLESIAYNQNRKNADLKLFEFGNTYHTYKEREFEEYGHIALFITGSKSSESWNTQKAEVDFFQLKGYVENILQRVGVNKFKVKECKSAYLSDGLSFETKQNKLVEFGPVTLSIQKNFDIKKPVFYADFNWEGILAEIANNKIKYVPLAKFPEVRRDLALLLDEDVKYADLIKIANQAGGNLLQSTNLFDVYEGKNLAAGKKSYAVSFIFQDTEKTLVDKQIDAVMNKLIDSYQKQLGAEIR